MTPQELADEILTKVEEGYKATVLDSAASVGRIGDEFGAVLRRQSRLGNIRVIVPIPGALLHGTSIAAIAEIVAQREFVVSAGQYEENVVRDDEGNVVENFLQQDMTPLEVICKPLRSVRLA